MDGEKLLILNEDKLWVGDEEEKNIVRIEEKWDDERMEIMLMKERIDKEKGYEGKGDFVEDEEGRMRSERDVKGEKVIYEGEGIIKKRIFEDEKKGIDQIN